MHEFVHVSEMIKEDKEVFEEFIKEMIKKSKDYIEFVKKFEEEGNFVNIEFYHLDSDDYKYPVFQWKVTFTPSKKNKLVFSGYYKEAEYTLINKETQKKEIKGDYEEVNGFLNKEDFKDMTQEDVKKHFKVDIEMVDKIKNWIKKVEDFELEFKPD